MAESRDAAIALEPFPLPKPVDDLKFSETGDIETMTARAGDLMTTERYTVPFKIVYAPRQSPFGAGRPLRVIDVEELEEKRRQAFGRAYRRLSNA